MWVAKSEYEKGIIMACGDAEFQNWETAKKEFRYFIKKEFGAKGIVFYTKQIDAYCKEFYPQGAPANFEQLKTILKKLSCETDYPQTLDDYQLDAFEDKNIKFCINDAGKLIINNINDKVLDKFPSAEIDIVLLDDPQKKYIFNIDDNRDPWEDRNHRMITITLSSKE